MYLLCFVFFFLIMIACSPTADVESPEESTALDHPPTDDDKFNEVKHEIDYWYNKPPRSIGQEHKMQIMGRLLSLNIDQADKDEYIQRLNSILLVDDSEYIKEMDAQYSLGTLCSGKNECMEFCATNRAQCEKYCHGRGNDFCTTLFPPNDKGPQGNKDCVGSGPVQFTSPPMQIGQIELIEPIGLMIGGHVTPIDHGYYYAQGWTDFGSREDATKFVDVYSPAAGIVTSVQSMPSEYSSSSIGDYRIVIHHTCSFYTIYIHVNWLSEKLRTVADTSKTVAIEAGEMIGKAPGFDFSVHDDEITLSGFIVAESYFAESWKLHNVDMFDSFAEPVRTQLLEKNVRNAEPRGGKIDHDIDGHLVGNWFEENTNGYFGKAEYQRGSGYWKTHLAFAYDGLDPSLIIISMGDYDGEAKQFAVKGNVPIPQILRQKQAKLNTSLLISATRQSPGLNGTKSFLRKLKKHMAVI